VIVTLTEGSAAAKRLKNTALEAVHGEDFVILAFVVLTQYRRVTDRQTDGRTPQQWLSVIKKTFSEKIYFLTVSKFPDICRYSSQVMSLWSIARCTKIR